MGIFSIFSRKEEFEPADLSRVGVDMHSHFIPAIDDGSKTLEDSVQMIGRMSELGYQKVITTPHIMSDFYRNTPEIIMAGLEKVRTACKEQNINIEINAAAEYYLDYDFEQKIETEPFLTFGDKYLLFEVSYLNAPDNIDSVVFQLQMQGYKPVLAHPERYPFWFKKFEKYEQLIEKGALLQMNINSLTGYYSLDTKKIAEQMIEKNMISFLGSDCHHLGHLNLISQARKEKSLHKLLDSGTLKNHTL